MQLGTDACVRVNSRTRISHKCCLVSGEPSDLMPWRAHVWGFGLRGKVRPDSSVGEGYGWVRGMRSPEGNGWDELG